MATVKHKVVKGDTLWDLAAHYGVSVNDIVKLNNITDPNFIVIGQELTIVDTGGGSSSSSKTVNTTSTPIIKAFGLQSNTDSTIYATWAWDKENTENYQVIWSYDTGDNIWFVGSDSTVKEKQATYGAPSNALRVKFKVKPISKKKQANDTETSYWTAGWSTEKIYSFSDAPPKKPSTPNVEIKDYKLTARLDNLDLNAKSIEFQIVKNDSSVFNTGTATIKTTSASYTCNVTAGNSYKVRCRSVRGSLKSEWSEYSSNADTAPATPKSIKTCKASSETSVYLEWEAVANAESYDIEYATKKTHFDGTDQTTTINGIKLTHHDKSGLTSGEEYFFRVRAVNGQGESGWTSIVSTVIGKAPAAPTTWSSTTTAVVGEELVLHWVHNSEDGSSQTYAELELTVNGTVKTHTIKNSTDEDKKDKTSAYHINTSDYQEGVEIQWRVRTRGVTADYGEWSIQRTVDIYAPPVLEMLVNGQSGGTFDTLEHFPINVSAMGGPTTQKPVSYHISIISNEFYQSIDDIGSNVNINAGAEVYSKHFDEDDALLVDISAEHVILENNISYTLTCVVSMDSGLTASSSVTFKVAWAGIEYEPNAEIGVNKDDVSAYIRPYCENASGAPIKDVLLSVYRREFDGSFTELIKDVENGKDIFITDPHPALDYARYRVIAKSKTNGSISFYDIPGYPVGEKAAVIQWDEEWTNFNASSEEALEQPPWSGSMLKLPYNLDVSDSRNMDVALVEYIGRKRPVSYYGTQLGETSSWNVEVPKDDVETLYALRRLSIWRGDVYVREPSGSGYWANIKVSFSQKHCEVAIPVSLDITRVEGGI